MAPPSSTAEAPAPLTTIAPVSVLPIGNVTPARSETHERRRSELIWYVRAAISRDEAEAMASPGFRFLPCGGCARLHCEWCNQDPAEQVKTSGRRASADPRFVSAILSRTKHTPPEILKRAMPALASLPPDQRYVLLLELGAGWRHDEIAERLKISRATVGRLREAGLTALVRMVWGDR